MQLTLDTGNGAYQIRSYELGKVLVNDELITTNCIISPEKLITLWQPTSFAELQLAHLQAIFELTPAIVLLGTGAEQRFLSAELLSVFYTRKIGIEVMNTAAACRTYNVLMAEQRKVVAALFLLG